MDDEPHDPSCTCRKCELERAIASLSIAQHELDEAEAALHEAKRRYLIALTGMRHARAVWRRLRGHEVGVKLINHGFVCIGIGVLIWVLGGSFHSSSLCDLRIPAILLILMGIASLCVGYYSLVAQPRREAPEAKPWWLVESPDGASVPQALLTELVKELGPERVAELMNDRKALKAALLEMHEKWRRHLLDEEGIEE